MQYQISTNAMNSNKEQHNAATYTVNAPQEHSAARAWVWVSVVLTLAAWAVLLWSNGCAALAVAIVAIIVGAIGVSKVSILLRRIGVSAIIASAVLAIVVSAYLIVLKLVI